MSQVVDFPKKEEKKKPMRGGLSFKIRVSFEEVEFTNVDGTEEKYRHDASGENEGKNVIKWPDTQD